MLGEGGGEQEVVGQVGPKEECFLSEMRNRNVGSRAGKPSHCSGTDLSACSGGDMKGKQSSPHKVDPS